MQAKLCNKYALRPYNRTRALRHICCDDDVSGLLHCCAILAILEYLKLSQNAAEAAFYSVFDVRRVPNKRVSFCEQKTTRLLGTLTSYYTRINHVVANRNRK